MPFEVDLDRLQKIVDEISPEIGSLWIERRDEFEDEGIRTGRLHENHILGIILSCDFVNEKLITTMDIENYYQVYFKKIARSTVSTYLNQLDKEGVLGKERKGRIVYYYLKQAPPKVDNPFWIIRNFCTLSPYFARALYMVRFYNKKEGISEDLLEPRNFVVGLAILNLFRNRFDKCIQCQFASRDGYRDLKENFDTMIKDRKDVLPEPLQNFVEKELGELPMFGGLNIPDKISDEQINKLINDLVERYAQDIDFQMNVAKRRQELRLKQKGLKPGV